MLFEIGVITLVFILPGVLLLLGFAWAVKIQKGIENEEERKG
jgi:chromate transport protein ChrA